VLDWIIVYCINLLRLFGENKSYCTVKHNNKNKYTVCKNADISNVEVHGTWNNYRALKLYRSEDFSLWQWKDWMTKGFDSSQKCLSSFTQSHPEPPPPIHGLRTTSLPMGYGHHFSQDKTGLSLRNSSLDHKSYWEVCTPFNVTYSPLP
jgi:hypothetical protein